MRVSVLSKPPDLTYARNVFEQMPQPNLCSYNTLIRAFAEPDDDPLQALRSFPSAYALWAPSTQSPHDPIGKGLCPDRRVWAQEADSFSRR